MTEFSDKTQRAQVAFDKKDNFYKRFLMAFYVYAAMLLTVGTVYSVSANYQIARNQKINTKASADRFSRYEKADERRQEAIQHYILCIATELSIPQTQRSLDATQDCQK